MSAPVDLLGLLDQFTRSGVVTMQEVCAARDAVDDLLAFVRACPCQCSAPITLGSGQVLPALQCARCDALHQAGAKP